MKNISIILPTRGRPALVKRLFDSLIETTAKIEDIEVVLYIDDDDVESHGITHTIIDIIKLIRPHGASLGSILNECYYASSGRYLFLMNDDAIYRTKGWDTDVLRAFEAFPDDIALVYGNDLDQGGKVPTFPIISRKTCEFMGGICPSEYLNLHIESHLLDIFKRLKVLGYDRIVYLDDVVFEHMHFQLGKTSFDATYKKKNQDHDDWHFLSFDSERGLAAKGLQGYIDGHRRGIADSGASKTGGARPDVSIIIPDANVSAVFEPHWLDSLNISAGDGLRVEILAPAGAAYAAVPGASLEKGYAIKIISDCAGLGFAEACNRCAKSAVGDYLVFLSSMAQPLAGWLGALLKTVKSDLKCAVAGAKLLDRRTGRVSHVGVSFYEENGFVRPSRVYNGVEATHPAVTRVREFQAMEPFCMAVRAKQFFDAGCFDAGMKEAAGLDLCLKLRKMGWKVLYAPQSQAILNCAGSVCNGRGEIAG
ncbi:glycosyltransferase, partial [bacterium]